MASLNFTADDLIKEIGRLDASVDGGFTTSEMSELINMSDAWCRAKLRKLVLAGRVECIGRRKSKTMDGRGCRIPVYRVVSNG